MGSVCSQTSQESRVTKNMSAKFKYYNYTHVSNYYNAADSGIPYMSAHEFTQMKCAVESVIFIWQL